MVNVLEFWSRLRSGHKVRLLSMSTPAYAMFFFVFGLMTFGNKGSRSMEGLELRGNVEFGM
jgi:hypothetical protein